MKISTPVFNEVVPFTANGSWLSAGKCKGVVLSNTNVSAGLTASLVTYKPGSVTNLTLWSNNTFESYDASLNIKNLDPTGTYPYWDSVDNNGTNVTDSYATNPFGVLQGASLISAETSTDLLPHHIHQTSGDFIPLVGQSYTMSCWVKLPTTSAVRYVQLAHWIAGFGANAWQNYDLVAGILKSGGTAVTAATMQSYSDGWFRISVTAPATATGAGAASGFQLVLLPTSGNGTSGRTPSFSDLIGLGVLAWGPQLETGRFANKNVNTAIKVVTESAMVLGETKIQLPAASNKTFPIRVWGLTYDSGVTGGSIS